MTTPASTPALAVLSNSDVRDTSPVPPDPAAAAGSGGAPARTRTLFYTTPRMSSYLLVLVAGPLSSTSATCGVPAPGKAVKVSVWATPDKWVAARRLGGLGGGGGAS